MTRDTSFNIKTTAHHKAKAVKQKIFQLTFPDWYGLAALGWLIVTTSFWSYLSALINLRNADQLVNPYLFETTEVFRGAFLPAAHTFLIKWPLFLVVKLFGYSNQAYVAATVATVLVTVFGFVLLLRTIDKRPLVWGSLCLMLASTMLFIPIEPYPGALLPANFGMLATRNIEYLWFMAAIALLVRADAKIRSKRFWTGVVLLALLIASDKLFFALGLGAACIALGGSLVLRNRERIRQSINWLSFSIFSYVAGSLLLYVVAILGVAKIASPASSNPYGLVKTTADIFNALFFALFGSLTNFGANPLFDIATRSAAQNVLRERLATPVIGAYVVHAGAAAIGSLLSLRLAINWLFSRKLQLSRAGSLAMFLVSATLTSLVIFVGTNHYYAADGRYLLIAPLSVLIVVAVYMRHLHLRPFSVAVFGLVMMICSLLGVVSFGQNYQKTVVAYQVVNERNKLVSQVIESHKVDTLLGDYWRVLPIKHISKKTTTVTPLSGCTETRQVLSSTAWQPNLDSSSFAYLLSLDKSMTDYPSCKLEDITKVYGRPNASVVVAGQLEKPEEMVLFYDKGANKSAPSVIGNVSEASSSTTSPTSTNQLRRTTCANNKTTIMNIVAHEDDDILFQNPDLSRDIASKNCVRTVYVTAGDAGGDPQYWLGREKGAQAAYSYMLGDQQNIWEERAIKLADGQFLTITNPRGNQAVSLIFMRLPDGNIHGTGFGARNYESLERLHGGAITELKTVDGQSSYNSETLRKALATVMDIYQPNEVRTQSSASAVDSFPDHSDHKTVGKFVREAHQQFANAAVTGLRYYSGYPVRSQPENIGQSEQDAKFLTFLEYAKHDGGVCNSIDACLQSPTYGAYLKRQYRQ